MGADNGKNLSTLTKEALLAQSEDEYMSEAQLDFFRSLLLAEKQSLVDAARETTLHLQDNEATPGLDRPRYGGRRACAGAACA